MSGMSIGDTSDYHYKVVLLRRENAALRTEIERKDRALEAALPWLEGQKAAERYMVEKGLSSMPDTAIVSLNETLATVREALAPREEQ